MERNLSYYIHDTTLIVGGRTTLNEVSRVDFENMVKHCKENKRYYVVRSSERYKMLVILN